jgi:hypothetical protein
MTDFSPEQLAWIERARRADILDVAQRPPIGATLKRAGREHVGPCPACGGVDRFAVNPKKKGGLFNCRGASGGDVIEMVMHCMAVEFIAACEIINGDPLPAGDRRISAEELKQTTDRMAREREERDRARAAEEAEYRERERKAAFEIWRAGTPIGGTPAQDYLRLRGILELPEGLVLRYTPAAAYFHGEEENEIGRMVPRVIVRGPAMLAPIVDAGGTFRGVHITWLDLELPKGKAIIVDPDSGEVLASKKSRGTVGGNIIRLAWPEGADTFYAGEGIETTLSVWYALKCAGRDLSRAAFASAVNLGNMGGAATDTVRHPTLKDKAGRTKRVSGIEPDQAPGLPLPAGCGAAVLLGDGDSDRFIAHCTLYRGQRRLARAGVAVRVAWASAGSDFNDDLMRGNQ